MSATAPLAPLSAHPYLVQVARGRKVRFMGMGEMFAQPIKRGNFAVVAFNARNIPLKPEGGWEEGYIGPSTVTPVLRAARDLEAPVVLEIADSELGSPKSPYTGALSRYGFTPEGIQTGLHNFVRHILAEYSRLDMAGIPIGIHYDHGARREILEACIKAGFTSAAFDGGNMKDWGQLTGTAREWVNHAHPMGVGIEGEIELVDVAEPTDPQKAIQFANETGIDVLVVTLAENVHGSLPGSSVMEENRLFAVRQALPEMPVNLHGGSGFALFDLARTAMRGGFQKLNYATVLYDAIMNKVPGMVQILNMATGNPQGSRPKAGRKRLADLDPMLRLIDKDTVKAAEEAAYRAAVDVMRAVGNVRTAQYYSA